MRRFISGVTLALSLALSARQTNAADLNYTDTITVAPGETKTIIFEHPLVEKAKVTVKSPGVPVNVHIVYETEAEAAEKAIQEGKPVKDKIVGVNKTEEKTFEFAPGKKPFAVLITPVGKAATVKVTATGK